MRVLSYCFKQTFNTRRHQLRARSICPCLAELPNSPSEEKQKEYTSSAQNVSPKRRFIVGGNFKMNGTKKSLRNIFKILEKGDLSSEADVYIGVPTVYLDYSKCFCPASVELAAQNCYKTAKGAFTGETSPAMLNDIGIDWVILGHSERRHLFGENDELVADKVVAARKFDLKVVVCIGETLAEREYGKTREVLFKQLKALGDKLKKDWDDIVIAYEPVWAIGTGQTATPAQVQEVHKNLRGWISKNVSKEISEAVRIQYGGSVNDKNCKELAQLPDIDGFLVGKASLKPEFINIINARK